MLVSGIIAIFLLAQTPESGKQPVSADELWLKLTLSGTRKRLSLVIADFNPPKPAKLDSARLPLGVIDLRRKEAELDTLAIILKEIQKVFTADLRFSLYFVIETPEPGKVYNFSTDPPKPDLKGWATTGAQVLICGDFVTKKGINQINLRLYDLVGSRLVATKSYSILGNYRWLAHRMADDVIKLLTGEEGVSCTRIAFSLRTGMQDKELAVVDYDGARLEQVTSSGGLKLFPAWSPNGERIVYCSYARGCLNIYGLDYKSCRSSIISGRKGLNTTPAISPDGKKIAASLSFEGNSEIYVMDINGDNLRRLTNHPKIDISPTWAPNGRQIAFVSDRTGTPQIYVVNVDGTDLRRLTYSGSYNTSPAWSPRGDLIAFVQRQPDGSNQICVTNILGDTYIRLTSQGNNEEPAWSPDGLHIAFQSDRTGTWEIWTMDWNGANQRRITYIGEALSPTWSPRLKE